MTRTPRVTDLRTLAGRMRGRIPEGLTRKTATIAGAGLVLAGVAGGVAVAGLSGSPASAAQHHVVTRAAGTAAVQRGAQARAATSQAPAQHAAPAKKQAKKQAPAQKAVPASKSGPAKKAAPAKKTAPAKKQAPAKKAAPARHARTWAAVSRIVADRTYPKPGHGSLPAQDQLTPVGTSGPQSSLPITPARYENAKTIVRQAIDKHMGLRSAVIAVATSMQESTLLNLHYGTSDSLGLFQQRPSCGWGTPAQIEHPSYAADAFLKALHGYQAQNPGWAHQPLWQTAQGVQGSAFPSAYAKWESQAANLVASVTKHLV